jgi:hypothetical protein
MPSWLYLTQKGKGLAKLSDQCGLQPSKVCLQSSPQGPGACLP